MAIEIPIPEPGKTDKTLYYGKAEQTIKLTLTASYLESKWTYSDIFSYLLDICDVLKLYDFILFGGA